LSKKKNRFSFPGRRGGGRFFDTTRASRRGENEPFWSCKGVGGREEMGLRISKRRHERRTKEVRNL